MGDYRFQSNDGYPAVHDDDGLATADWSSSALNPFLACVTVAVFCRRRLGDVLESEDLLRRSTSRYCRVGAGARGTLSASHMGASDDEVYRIVVKPAQLSRIALPYEVPGADRHQTTPLGDGQAG